MRRPALLAATAITGLLGIYMALVLGRAFVLLRDDALTAKALGAALLVMPIVGAWYLWHEWSLGFAAQRMGSQLEQEGRLPVHDGARGAGGALTEEAARDVYELARRGVDEQPDDWRAWFHLAYGYEAMKDKSQARKAMRYAADLYRRR